MSSPLKVVSALLTSAAVHLSCRTSIARAKSLVEQVPPTCLGLELGLELGLGLGLGLALGLGLGLGLG